MHILNLETQNAPNCDEKLKSIVEFAIESKLKSNAEVNTPSYSQIAAKNSNNQIIPKQTRETYKVIVKPDSSLTEIKTAEDTRKILTSKSPKQYNINVDKIVPLRNNAILLESRCSSILSVPNNKTLKSLNLVAERVAQTHAETHGG
jgi:hypothetical protein